MEVSKYFCDHCGKEISCPNWHTVKVVERNNFKAEMMLCEDCWYNKIRPFVMNNFKTVDLSGIEKRTIKMNKKNKICLAIEIASLVWAFVTSFFFIEYNALFFALGFAIFFCAEYFRQKSI